MARIGIIGTGFGARVQTPLFREAGLDVVALAGFHPAKTREIAGELGLRAYDDWRELAAAPDIDLVSVTSPPSQHREMATAVLDAGKHCLCEKPTALNADEAQQLVDAAKRHPNQIAIIDHELRFVPSWRDARARIGEIGALRYAEVRYASPSRGDRKRAWNWWSDATAGGGILGAVGSHYIDALRWLGMEVEEVRAHLRTIVDRRPFEDGSREVTSDDFASVELKLRGGANAVLLLLGAGMLAMFYLLTLYMQVVRGYSALHTGLAYLPYVAGVSIAVACGLGYARITEMPARVVDLAPHVAVGHAFGKIGCLLAGCCHGLPTTSWIGMDVA